MLGTNGENEDHQRDVTCRACSFSGLLEITFNSMEQNLDECHQSS